MTAIRSGSVNAFFLYDVAEAISLTEVARLIAQTTAVKMAPKPPTPPYIQYRHPPLSIDGHAAGLGEVEGFHARVKAFDYGVLSIALTRGVPETWESLLLEGLRWHDDSQLAAGAERLCRTLIERLRPALLKPRADLLFEDYLVVALTHVDGISSAEELITAHGSAIAQLLRGEREPLSAQERDEVLRHRLSYLADDAVVATWNAAFVYDSEPGIQGTLDIIEFANSQLLEFRYYDDLLDHELERIYPQLQRPGWSQNWLGRRFARAARHVHSLFIDVNELTDKTENALKIVGDVYAARLFTLVAARLGLDQWKENVRGKLKTLDDIYRFAVEQTAMARGELLELTIVLILMFELVLFFAGLR